MLENCAKKVMVFALVLLGVLGIWGAIASIGRVENVSDSKSNITITQQQAEPVKTTEIKTERKVTAFETETIEDANLEYGKTATRTTGVNGEVVYTYEVTYENGREVSREQLSREVTKQPINAVIAKGTKIMWHCVDTTSYDKNPYNDNKCTSSTGEVRYLSDSQARALDPTYIPGKAGHWYYNSK